MKGDSKVSKINNISLFNFVNDWIPFDYGRNNDICIFYIQQEWSNDKREYAKTFIVLINNTIISVYLLY